MSDQPATQTVHVTPAIGIPDGTMLRTAEGLPDVMVKTRPWWHRTLIRIFRVYIVALTGILPVVLGNPGNILMPLPDFTSKLLTAASVAVAPAVAQLLINLAEWLVREDSR
jgi:hypothetical protein